MGHTIKLAAVGAVAFMVLDGVWLGLLMKNFYREQLAPIVRLADGGIAPNWPAAFVVYALLGTGIAALRHPARVDGLVRGGLRRPVRPRGVRRLRLHQLLHAAPVAVRADAGRRGVGSGWRRPRAAVAVRSRGPMSRPRDGARALSDPRGLQADRHRYRHAARVGAPPRRRHARSVTTAAACTRKPTSRACACCSGAVEHGTQHRPPAPGSPTMRTAPPRRAAGASAAPRGRSRHGGRRSIRPRSPPRCRATTPSAIDQEIARLAAVLRPLELLRDVLMPVLAQVGDDWHRGRGAHRAGAPDVLDDAEHPRLVPPAVRAPRDVPARLLFATPAGERHEIGTLGAAMLAASSGLGVAYLGPDLPAREIVESVRPAGAQVLVLGLTDGVGRRRRRSGNCARSSAISRRTSSYGPADAAPSVTPRSSARGD